MYAICIELVHCSNAIIFIFPSKLIMINASTGQIANISFLIIADALTITGPGANQRWVQFYKVPNNGQNCCHRENAYVNNLLTFHS